MADEKNPHEELIDERIKRHLELSAAEREKQNLRQQLSALKKENDDLAAKVRKYEPLSRPSGILKKIAYAAVLTVGIGTGIILDRYIQTYSKSLSGLPTSKQVVVSEQIAESESALKYSCALYCPDQLQSLRPSSKSLETMLRDNLEQKTQDLAKLTKGKSRLEQENKRLTAKIKHLVLIYKIYHPELHDQPLDYSTVTKFAKGYVIPPPPGSTTFLSDEISGYCRCEKIGSVITPVVEIDGIKRQVELPAPPVRVEDD